MPGAKQGLFLRTRASLLGGASFSRLPARVSRPGTSLPAGAGLGKPLLGDHRVQISDINGLENMNHSKPQRLG